MDLLRVFCLYLYTSTAFTKPVYQTNLSLKDGEEQINYLNTPGIIPPHTGPYQVAWITEPQANETMTKRHLFAFRCYMSQAAELEIAGAVTKRLGDTSQYIDDLISYLYKEPDSQTEQDCQLPENLKNNHEILMFVRTLLTLYTQWLGKGL
ncbi:hypothetical protein DPEC_G00264190 [Dallia pectoralis]|uniref:Uncharacterized protein n=1 Tax=Dallia pectoralis TaxID=75939 RepID=A0ACC2FSE2_DALPE|nr:hypothetical protein DPEC_G00264190 [Dallia pectoralis]